MQLEKKAAKIMVEGVGSALEQVVNECSDEAMDKAFDELKKIIPGQVDDAILDIIKPTLKPLAKAELLKLVAQVKELAPQE